MKTRHQQVLDNAVDLCAKLRVDTESEVIFVVDGARWKTTVLRLIQSGLEAETKQAPLSRPLKR